MRTIQPTPRTNLLLIKYAWYVLLWLNGPLIAIHSECASATNYELRTIINIGDRVVQKRAQVRSLIKVWQGYVQYYTVPLLPNAQLQTQLSPISSHTNLILTNLHDIRRRYKSIVLYLKLRSVSSNPQLGIVVLENYTDFSTVAIVLVVFL